MTNISDIDTIIDTNTGILTEFFAGIASCEYYDNMSHQLYLDLDDGKMFINLEAVNSSYLCRDDGSLIRVLCVSGICDTPEDERYDAESGDSLEDYGFSDWLDQVRAALTEVLAESKP